MEVYKKMYAALEGKAKNINILNLTIGLGYTAVSLEDGSIGLAYTWLDSKKSCTLFKDPEDYEGKPAIGLLDKLFSTNLVEKSVAMAAVNAVNYSNCLSLPDDKGNLIEDLAISEGTKVSMIGFFAPVVEEIKKNGGIMNVFDIGKGVGAKDEFYEKLEKDTDSVILTSTSLINGSTEEVLSHVQEGTPCVMLGPTTPMMPEVFSHLPVTILGGMQPRDRDTVIKVIRHGKGTRDIQKYSRKVYWKKG